MGEKRLTPQESFNIASGIYEKSVEKIKQISFLAKKTKDRDFNEAVALRQFDCILQCVLLRAALIDGHFNPLEKQFIDKLTNYGDILAYLRSNTDLNIDWDEIHMFDQTTMMKLVDIIEKELKEYANNFVDCFALLDAEDDTEDYLKEFEGNILIIISTLSLIDEDAALAALVAGKKQVESLLVDRWKVIRHLASGIEDKIKNY